MNRFIITSLLVLSALIVRADDRLILAKVEDPSHLYSLFENQDLTIHYYSDNFVIASLDESKTIALESFVLDEKAFSDVASYSIVYCREEEKDAYLKKVSGSCKVLFSGENFLIVKILSEGFMPAKNDGMVSIRQTKAYLPQRTFDFPVVTEEDPVILNLIEMVKTDSVMATIQHLQDYGTRAYDEPQAYEAQEWMQAKYDAMGLETEIQNFNITPSQYWGWSYYPHLNSSGNVIAVQKGTVSPDEYIVCGAHYDSWSWYPITQYNCPGADDNASGTAGIMEIARILSQYESERSIIYCCFSAEEFGLWGSNAYASFCKQEKMNILGYFNLDMIGYLKPSSPIHVSLIYPSTAAPLANYNNGITNTYFPNIPIKPYANMSGGDSDHTSFNQKGYMGIWTFEDWKDDSPEIHGPNDIIGPSVNNPEQCRVFTQMNLASIATLAGILEETDLPIPAFKASKTTIMEKSTVQFTDISKNDPTEWHWDFYGGKPEKFDGKEPPEILYDTPGSYDVKLVITNSFGIDSLLRKNYITVKMLPPIADFEANITKIIEDDSVSFSNLSKQNPQSYQWYFEGVTPMQNNQKDPVVCYKKAGVYSVRLTVKNEGGESTEIEKDYITVTPKTAITEQDMLSKISVHPNPTSGEIVVSSEYRVQSIAIFDVMGKRHEGTKARKHEGEKCVGNVETGRAPSLQSEIGQSEIAFNISHLPAGIYFLRIQTENNVITKKIVKQ
jgi:PKD repeat protein